MRHLLNKGVVVFKCHVQITHFQLLRCTHRFGGAEFAFPAAEVQSANMYMEATRFSDGSVPTAAS